MYPYVIHINLYIYIIWVEPDHTQRQSSFQAQIEPRRLLSSSPKKRSSSLQSSSANRKAYQDTHPTLVVSSDLKDIK